MAGKKRYVVAALVLLGIAGLTQVEFVRRQERGLAPAVPYSLPRITIDADGAIRLGAMAKWNAPHGGGGANYQLAKLLINGDGVPRDRQRAMVLLEQADDNIFAQDLLQSLRQEADTLVEDK